MEEPLGQGDYGNVTFLFQKLTSVAAAIKTMFYKLQEMFGFVKLSFNIDVSWLLKFEESGSSNNKITTTYVVMKVKKAILDTITMIFVCAGDFKKLNLN